MKRDVFYLMFILLFSILAILLFVGPFSIKASRTNGSALPNAAESNVASLSADFKALITTPSAKPTQKPASNSFCLNVPVLQYHHVEPASQAEKLGHKNLFVSDSIFDDQMKYLVNHGYRTISSEELVKALRERQPLSGKTAVITIDDGYDDAYSYAYPIAKKYGVILNLMIPTGLMENQGYLKWSDLREMVNSGLVYAYNHTWSHFSLTDGDAEKIKMEVITAKTQLEEQLGRPVTILAYPYGAFDQKVIEILKSNGFSGAFSSIHSFSQCEDDLFSLHRNHIGNESLSAYGL